MQNSVDLQKFLIPVKLTLRMSADTEILGPDSQHPQLSLHQNFSEF